MLTMIYLTQCENIPTNKNVIKKSTINTNIIQLAIDTNIHFSNQRQEGTAHKMHKYPGLK